MQALSSVSMPRALKPGPLMRVFHFEQPSGCRLVHFLTFTQTSVC